MEAKTDEGARDPSQEANGSRELESNDPNQFVASVVELNRDLRVQNHLLREHLAADIKQKWQSKSVHWKLQRENKQLQIQVQELREQLREQNENAQEQQTRLANELAQKRCESTQLRLQVQELQKKVDERQGVHFVTLVSAQVVESRISTRNGKHFVEYKIEVKTDSRGLVYVWYRYSMFAKLVEKLKDNPKHLERGVPRLPNKKLFGHFSEKNIQERMIALNQFLDVATSAEHLQWGIRVDSTTCVYKRRVKSKTPKAILTTKAWEFQSNKDEMKEFVEVLSAKVVGHRIQIQADTSIVEYQLSIKAKSHNSVLVWHDYTAVFDWVTSIQTKTSYKLPQLKKEKTFGSFSRRIKRNAERMDDFFTALFESGSLRWQIRIDSEMCVFKLRVRNSIATPGPVLRGDDEESKPHSAVSKLLAFAKEQRQRPCRDAILFDRKLSQAG